MALTAYFDASGSRDDGRVLVVSGFASSLRRWRTFEREWASLLAFAGIRYFRMAEFAHTTGEFSSWKGKEGKRRKFLADLIDIIVANVEQSFAAGVLLKDWRQCNRLYRLREEGFSPYSLCGWTCVELVQLWCKEQGHARELVLFVFEHGDADQGE